MLSSSIDENMGFAGVYFVPPPASQRRLNCSGPAYTCVINMVESGLPIRGV
jgi:hypothetical protein